MHSIRNRKCDHPIPKQLRDVRAQGDAWAMFTTDEAWKLVQELAITAILDEACVIHVLAFAE
jgi:hypothetical protein